MPLAKDLMFDPLPKLPGKTIVYAGGLQPRRSEGTIYGYRCYHDIFAALMEAGWEVHIYCAATNNFYRTTHEYAELGCIMHDPVLESELPREASQYGAGFLGYAKHAEPRAYAYAHSCLPNKAFQWLGAGIPTLALDAGYAGQVAEQGGWGVQATWENLGSVELPTITEGMRRAHVFEHQEPILRRAVKRAMMTAGPAPTLLTVEKEALKVAPKDTIYTIQMRTVVNGYVRYKRGTEIPMDEALDLAADGCIVDPKLRKPLEARTAARKKALEKALVKPPTFDPRTETKPDGPDEVKARIIALKARCTARTVRGTRCKRFAIPGGDKCSIHA